MQRIRRYRRASWPMLASLLAVLGLVAACAGILPPRGADEGDLLATGFKPLVAATPAQEEWVRTLAPGKIRAMQRNDKKFFVYPDAAKNRILVGGPQQYEAYLQKHPEGQVDSPDAGTAAYRLKQDDAMKKATARDLSDPFLGASWGDFGW